MDKYYTKNNIKYIKTSGHCLKCDLFYNSRCGYNGDCEIKFCYQKINISRKEKIEDMLK